MFLSIKRPVNGARLCLDKKSDSLILIFNPCNILMKDKAYRESGNVVDTNCNTIFSELANEDRIAILRTAGPNVFPTLI